MANGHIAAHVGHIALHDASVIAFFFVIVCRKMPARNKGQRSQWSQENMTKAIAAVKGGMAIYRASITYHIPRRTLRRYLLENKQSKSSLGRKPVLTAEQETELVQRIIRLSEVGYPITSKILRSCVYRYTKQNNISNPFTNSKEMAGRYWLKGFFSRNPQISQRKAQNLNPARAQKLNPFIVEDHFTKLQNILTEMDIIDKPERIYNIDEKGCRLCLHSEQMVLAQKGARRVHIVGNEHGENVTIVSCGNALGSAIPPVILFKGKRMKPEWNDGLPPGSEIIMTPKGSMTTASFCSWIDHFGKYKTAGPCLLIFDGAKSHLDYSIVEKADQYDITLYCLPSNTTHELQPMDKSVFRAFEYHWNDEVLKYLTVHKHHSITKQRFGPIFSKVWDKTMTPSNIKSGFSATGIYPFDKDRIPEVAYAPSSVTQRSHEENINADRSTTSTSCQEKLDIPSTSGLSKRKHNINNGSSNSEDSDSSFTVHDESSNDLSIESEKSNKDDAIHVSFQEMLNTPNEVIIKGKTPRKQALNSKAQVVKRDLFDIAANSSKSKSDRLCEPKKKPRKSTTKESWFCKLCNEDRVADMRLCNTCKSYVHEECVGLTKNDKQVFFCPDCQN